MPEFDPMLLLIPVIAGVIGYGTNWLAVRMTFHPMEFVGVRPYLGWQGIVPSKARKMAAIAVDTGISKLGTVPEIAQYFDPERIAEHLVVQLDPQVPQLVEDLAREGERARWWATLPPPARAVVVQRVRRQLPGAIHRLMRDVEENIEDLIDIRMMVVDLFGARKDLIVRMFKVAGEKEFRFLVNSGFWFGAILGLPQMLLSWLVPSLNPYVFLPIAGLLVGYATNFLALKLIFEPVEPRRILGQTIQGLFLQRQAEVAEVYCHLVTRDVLTLRNFIDRMLTGPRSDRMHALLQRHVGELVDESMGVVRPAVELAVGRDEYAEIGEAAGRQALSLSASSLDDPAFNAERAAAVEVQMRQRMVEMTSAEFAGMLRPVFQEDELTLILVGAALGGFAGLLQASLLF